MIDTTKITITPNSLAYQIVHEPDECKREALLKQLIGEFAAEVQHIINKCNAVAEANAAIIKRSING